MQNAVRRGNSISKPKAESCRGNPEKLHMLWLSSRDDLYRKSFKTTTSPLATFGPTGRTTYRNIFDEIRCLQLQQGFSFITTIY